MKEDETASGEVQDGRSKEEVEGWEAYIYNPGDFKLRCDKQPY